MITPALIILSLLAFGSQGQARAPRRRRQKAKPPPADMSFTVAELEAIEARERREREAARRRKEAQPAPSPKPAPQPSPQPAPKPAPPPDDAEAQAALEAARRAEKAAEEAARKAAARRAAEKRAREEAARKAAARREAERKAAAEKAAAEKREPTIWLDIDSPKRVPVDEPTADEPPPADMTFSLEEAEAPELPEGYDAAKARKVAKQVSNHLRNAGIANYSRSVVKAFQRAAGIPQDGIYGGGTRGALVHYGATSAPRPFFKPVQTQPYTPPEER